MRLSCLCSLVLFARLVVSAQDLQELQKKTSEFTLPNGLHFIVLQRQDSPVVAFHTLVNVGSMQDPGGETGLAHMFEHLAFKGTESIGTRDWPEEKKALDAVEEAYDRMEAEANKGVEGRPDAGGHAAQSVPPGGRQRTAPGRVRRLSSRPGRKRWQSI